MLRLKRHLRHAVPFRYIHGLGHGFYGNHILGLDFGLGFGLFGGLDVHHFHAVRVLTVLLHGRTAEGDFHDAVPDLVVQLVAVGIQKVDVVGQGGDNLFLLAGGSRLGLHILLYYVLNAGYHAGRRLHSCRQHPFSGADGDLHPVVHGQNLLKSRMFASLRHHHIHVLFFHNLRHIVPYGLGTVVVFRDGVGGELLAVGENGLHGIADLILYTEV